MHFASFHLLGSSSSELRAQPKAEAAMSCFDGLLALWRGPPAADAKRLLSPTACGDQRNNEDTVSNIATGAAQAESRPSQLVEPDNYSGG